MSDPKPSKEGDGWWWPTPGVTTDSTASGRGNYDTPPPGRHDD
jgi:hypothetical protein